MMITRLVIDGPAGLRKDGFEALVAEADLIVSAGAAFVPSTRMPPRRSSVKAGCAEIDPQEQVKASPSSATACASGPAPPSGWSGFSGGLGHARDHAHP